MTENTPHSVKSIGHGTLWSLMNNGVSQLLALAVFLVTARFVSQEAFGIMAVCFVMLELFRQVSVESIGIALTAKKDAQDKDYNASFVLNLAISLLGAAALFLSAPLLADFLKNDNFTRAIELTSVMVLTSGLSRTHEAWLSRHMQFKSLAIRSLFSILAGGTTGIILAVQGWGLSALIAQQIVTSIVGTIFLWSTTAWRPRLRTDGQSVRNLLHEAKHIMLTGLSNFANGQSDTFFSAYYLGPVSTGIYNAAKRITLALNALVSTALGKVSLPAFALIQHDPVILKSSYLKAVCYTTLFTAPLYAGIIALSHDLVFILLGDKWIQSAPILAILTGAAYLTTIGQYNQHIFLVSGRAHWQTILATIYAVANVLLFVLFARYGLLALATAFTLRALLLYPLSAGGALYLLKIPALEYLRHIVPSVAAAIGMGGIVFFAGQFIEMGSIARVAILIPLGMASYGVLIFLFDRKVLKEAIHIIRIVAFSKTS